MGIISNDKNVVVVDLDGTLADCSHRDHLARLRLWDDFHRGLHLDVPRPDVAKFLALLSSTRKLKPYSNGVIALTGRPADYRAETYRWLAEHDIAVDLLLMRPSGDFSPDTEIKPNLLLGYYGSLDRALERIWVILEDRDKMVAKWRELGFPCWQVQPGAF